MSVSFSVGKYTGGHCVLV